VLWAWLNDSDNHANVVARGWSGLQSFPRARRLDGGVNNLLKFWYLSAAIHRNNL
jgi:beta-fructofuranosidase